MEKHRKRHWGHYDDHFKRHRSKVALHISHGICEQELPYQSHETLDIWEEETVVSMNQNSRNVFLFFQGFHKNQWWINKKKVIGVTSCLHRRHAQLWDGEANKTVPRYVIWRSQQNSPSTPYRRWSQQPSLQIQTIITSHSS